MIFHMRRENNQLIQRAKLIEIHRKPVLHLTDFNEIPNMNFEGTFTELLQAKEPTEFQIRESKQIIAEMTESI